MRQGIYWHILPTYGEAKDAVWRDPAMLFHIIPEELILKRNEQEMVVYLKNGSIIQLKGSDDPDALRGANPVGVVFDEWDTQKAESWPIIEPILRANSGWAWFIGTPRGKGKLYDLYNKGQKGLGEWKSYLLRATESGIISKNQLEEAKKSMSTPFFNQEFECEFLEGEGSVFRGVKKIMTAVPKKPESGHSYVMGCDLAKVQDFTVMRVYDRGTNELVYSDRFQTLEWPFQKKKIKAIANLYGANVIIDSTGLGDPIADDLAREGISIEGFKISQSSKKEIVEKLSIWIEQEKIHIFPQDEAVLEYDNFSFIMGDTGQVRYGARTGYHDDIVMADALACYALNPIIGRVKPEEMTRAQIALQQAVKAGQENDYESEWIEWNNL